MSRIRTRVDVRTRRWGLPLLLFVLFVSSCMPDDGDLALAVSNGNRAQVKDMLAAGSDPNLVSFEFGVSATAVAASEGHFESLLVLHAAGGDLNVLDEHGDSMLTLLAWRGGDLEIAKWLVLNGADPCVTPSDVLQEVTGVDSASEMASREGQTDLAGFLSRAEAACS